jgi:hypothetical protein
VIFCVMYCTMNSGVLAAYISSLVDLHKHYNGSTPLKLTSMLIYHTTLGHQYCRLASLTPNMTSTRHAGNDKSGVHTSEPYGVPGAVL